MLYATVILELATLKVQQAGGQGISLGPCGVAVSPSIVTIVRGEPFSAIRYARRVTKIYDGSEQFARN
jgi:hypothetical protein